jgi:asparagine synthase (glutamine-hydrolysing)
MSGISGIVNFDRSPVDALLLRRMSDCMTYRGPDRQDVWAHGNVGFVHTLLETANERQDMCQPFTMDGRSWVVADARVDARAELLAEMETHGVSVDPGATDVELILRAYQVWGEGCVEHLLGDFAFAVWDEARRALFLARDHLGVKPLFFARLGHGDGAVFSNTLECIRLHSRVSSELNDLAIADFLLFGMNQEPGTTSFADVRRLPPAHCATWSETGLKARRYWTLPIDEPLRYRSAADYTDQFLELLATAVHDRLRTKKVGIFMSGGLDSTSIAAAARRDSGGVGVRAFTTLVRGVTDDKEEFYAGLAASRLGIPISFRDLRDDTCQANSGAEYCGTPEPVIDPTSLESERTYYREVSSWSRVCFYGEGPDNALRYEWAPYFAFLARKRRFGRIVHDLFDHVKEHRRVPFASRLVRLASRGKSENECPESFPEWLDEDLASRLGLRARWDEVNRSAQRSRHPTRPVAYESFTGILWESVLHGFDGEETKAPLEVRHPFLDLRLLRYMLAVPPIPWCREKHLLRRAMRRLLPYEVLRRPKAPVLAEPAWPALERRDFSCFVPAPALRRYVDTTCMANGSGVGRFGEARPRALNLWLQTLDQTGARTVS